MPCRQTIRCVLGLLSLGLGVTFAPGEALAADAAGTPAVEVDPAAEVGLGGYMRSSSG